MFLQKIVNCELFQGKNFYWKVLFSFIGMALLIVLSTSLLFATMYIRNIYRQLSLDAINSVTKLTNEFDNEIKKIREIDLYLTQVPDINTFLYSANTPDYLTISRADIVSRRVVNFCSYLYSIIIYNTKTGQTLISGKLNIDKNQFFKGDLHSPDTVSINDLVFSQIAPHSTKNKPTETISIVFNDFGKDKIADSSSIIMTIDRDEIERKLLGNIPGITIMADNSGKILFSNDQAQQGSLSGLSYFKKIRFAHNVRGSFKGRIARSNTLISFTKSNQTGFYVINLWNPDSYTKIILKSELTILGFSVIILIAFLLIGYLMSKQLYLPINNIIKLFAGSQFGGEDPQSEEIETITKVFNKALQHIDELKIRSEDANNKLKEEFLRCLLRTGVPREEAAHGQPIPKFDIVVANLLLACIKIDDYNYMERNRKFAYEATLCSIIPEILKNHEYRCETVNMYEGEIAIFLNFEDVEPSDFTKLLMALDQFRKIARDKLQITISIGIGGLANDLEECFGCYQQAIEMVKHRFVLGPDHTIHPRLLEDSLVTNANYPIEMVDKLIKALRLNRQAEFNDTLHSITELLKQFPYQRSAVMILQIITECIKAINNLTQNDGNGYYLFSYDFGSVINSFETIDQAKNWLTQMFADYQKKLEQIKQLKNSKHYKLVAKMQEYIKANYRDSNLNVESIATTAGYTSYYFSKIFKEITGLNVVDYIKQIRINHAKELLYQNEIKVSEIPDLIGFANPGHFYTIFKNDVGLTPSAYREYILNK